MNPEITQHKIIKIDELNKDFLGKDSKYIINDITDFG